MGATLLAFSYNVLVGIELIAGAPLPQQQQEDYLALWRYVGWLLGVESNALDPCRNPVGCSCIASLFELGRLTVVLMLCNRSAPRLCSSPS